MIRWVFFLYIFSVLDYSAFFHRKELTLNESVSVPLNESPNEIEEKTWIAFSASMRQQEKWSYIDSPPRDDGELFLSCQWHCAYLVMRLPFTVPTL